MKQSYNKAFTIVELLIVVVVIAILAAITIVAYSGIRNSANDSVVRSDLSQSLKNMMLFETREGRFPRALSSDIDASVQAELNSTVVATRSAYLTTGNSYLYCKNNQSIALIGRSKSGKGFYAGTNGSGEFSSWPGNGNAQLCPAVGIEVGSGGYENAWIYSGAGDPVVYQWRPWFTGVGR